MAKQLRHANGTGSIAKLSGRRRKPYIARVTTGWTNDGTAIRESIGTFSSKAKAQDALNAYNSNPYSLEAKGVTFAEVYDRVLETHVAKLSQSAKNGYIAAYRRCESIKDKPLREIKTDALQAVVDGSGVGYESRRKLIVLLSEVYKYAMANDIVQKDYSRYVTTKRQADDKKLERHVVTDSEIARLFDLVPEQPGADLLLIMIYTGLRVGELFDLKTEGLSRYTTK